AASFEESATHAQCSSAPPARQRRHVPRPSPTVPADPARPRPRGRGCPVIRHPEAVKCLQIHGWDLCRWCASCRRDWEQFDCPEHDARQPASPTYCDVIVAYAVLDELERITVPTFAEVVERPRPTPSFEPGEN